MSPELPNHDQQNIKQLVEWMRANRSFDDGHLRETALRSGYTEDQIDSALKAVNQETVAMQRISDISSKSIDSRIPVTRLWLKRGPSLPLLIILNIIVVAIITVAELTPDIPGPPASKLDFSGFSSLVINSAEAMGNFTLAPEHLDSLGVAPDSSYILKSKIPVATALIKENLKIESVADYSIQEISPTEWRIVPSLPLNPNTIIKIVLASSYVNEDNKQEERDYSWAYQIKDHFKVLLSIPRHAGTNVPANTGIEVTFSHENISAFDNYFSIEPTVEGRFEQHGRTMVFVPAAPLKQGSLYTVTVKKGLSLIGSDETLLEDYTFSFDTERPRPYDSTNAPWLTVEDLVDSSTADPPAVQVYGGNLLNNSIQVDIYSLDGWQGYLDVLERRDRLPWWSMSKQDFLEDTSKLKKLDSFSVSAKTEGYSQFIQLPTTLPAGYYIAEFRVGEVKDQTFLQVTNLSTYLNITKDKTIVWVNDLSQKKPVSSATVEIIGLGQYPQTNTNGAATFSTPPELINYVSDTRVAKRYYLRVLNGDQNIIVPASYLTSGGRYYYEGFYDEWGSSADNEYWSYLYTDRPRYQTTDVIKFWGLLRERNNDKVPIGDVSISMFKEGYVDYYYQPVRVAEQKVNMTDIGTFAGELKYSNLRPDYYTLELSAGERVIARLYLNIEPYTKPAYKLTLTSDRTVVYAGDAVNILAKAAFFDDTPVPNLKLNYETPEGDQEIITNKDGEVKLTYTKPYKDCAAPYCWPTNAWLKISLAEGELAEIADSATITIFGPNIYLQSEVKYPSRGMVEVTAITRAVDIEAVINSSPGAPGKAPAPGTKLEGKLTQIKYLREQTGTAYDFINKRTYPTFKYSQERKIIDEFRANTDSSGRYAYRHTTEPESSYILQIRAYDRNGRFDTEEQYFYYYDGVVVNSNLEKGSPYYHLDIPNDARYSVGEQVTARFLNNDQLLPIGTSDNFLFLQLHNGLTDFETSNQPTYRFVFKERDIPNVFILGVYFNGHTYVSSGLVSARFVIEDRRLKIGVARDQDRYEPGGNVNLNISVADSRGRPVAAEINLNLVDEAYYAVSDESAAPLESIYRSIDAGIVYSSFSHKPPMGMFGGVEKGCFLGGTKITMADGTTKPIEEVRVGDQVLTLINPLSTRTSVGTVVKTFKHTVGGYLVINGKLRVTPEHRVYTNHSFRTAGELKIGDWMLGLDGRKIRVESIEEKKDIVTVYNLQTDPQHTFIADGYYVHNEKGGAEVRQFFTDVALFQVVSIGSNGRGTASFTLPDNITSWRVTAQGISSDLGAGIAVSNIPVSLPVFADVTLSNEYLTSDRPAARLRAFGTALDSSTQVSFNVSAPTLGVDNSAPIQTTAFSSAYFPLPDLKLGRHDLIYTLNTVNGNDAVKLPIDVIASRLLARQIIYQDKLTPKTKLHSADNQPITVVLSDQGQNQLYGPLISLSASWGDRVDQSLARKKAIEILNNIYKANYLIPPFNGERYQLTDGGIALLPYGGSDLALSARLAAVASEEFDRVALRQYFFTKLEAKDSMPEEVTLALYGLAALGEPVLARLAVWQQRSDLTPLDRLYLGLAAEELGAGEWARTIFLKVINDFAVTKGPEIAMRVNDRPDDVIQATALAAILASAIDTPERDGLWRYMETHLAKDLLLNLEELSYIQKTIVKLRPSPAKVTYSIAGQKRTVTITGAAHSFRLETVQLSQVSFDAIEGDVVVAVSIVRPVTADEIAKSGDIGIRREYWVNGQRTNNIKENELIEVRLYPSFSEQSPEDAYQITDILPSGLLPVTKYYYGTTRKRYDNCHYWYPYDTDNQRVRYSISKNWKRSYCGGDYISYYARVKTKGSYTAEPAIIQSFMAPDIVNHSAIETVNIE